MAESTIEMQVRNENEKQDDTKPKPVPSAGKIFYKPGVIEEETDDTSVFDSSMVESPMLGNSMVESPMMGGYMSGGFLKPPLQIYPSSSLHRIPTYSSSIGQSTVYRPDSCRRVIFPCFM